MIQAPLAVAAVVAAVAALAFVLDRRVPALSKVGASLLCIVFGAALSNLGLVPASSPFYDGIGGPVTSLAIAWLLLAVNLSDVPRAGPRVVGAFALACLGTAVGAFFAAICFAASVFSLPFIANRDVDVITAVVSSVNAVLRNRWTMALWGIIVVVLTVVGFLTAMAGFIVIIPWLGYATWHGYRDTLQVEGWDTLPSAG